MNVLRRGRREGVRWIDACNLFSGGRSHEFIVDEQANGLLVFPAIGSLKVNEEVRHSGALKVQIWRAVMETLGSFWRERQLVKEGWCRGNKPRRGVR